ncbi:MULTISPECIES: hypothetical protein [unclassified Roseovarius]|uniref:hypothetical protein n=1 Tax=unclassified Roseovarius TaxID=2614913 RepID=UPI00273F7B49|nr:hypothetical protein [Roseovarius sp. MMSF_3350]
MGDWKAVTTTKTGKMRNRRDDIEYLLWQVRKMQAEQQIRPFAFHRAVVLLVRDERFIEALAICEYVQRWCVRAEAYHDGTSEMIWKSPRLRNCIERIDQLYGNL